MSSQFEVWYQFSTTPTEGLLLASLVLQWNDLYHSSPGSFYLIGPTTRREISSNLITLSSPTFLHYDNYSRGPTNTANRDQHLTSIAFSFSLNRKISSFQTKPDWWDAPLLLRNLAYHNNFVKIYFSKSFTGIIIFSILN